jgi:hypothetical protein
VVEVEVFQRVMNLVDLVYQCLSPYRCPCPSLYWNHLESGRVEPVAISSNRSSPLYSPLHIAQQSMRVEHHHVQLVDPKVGAYR